MEMTPVSRRSSAEEQLTIHHEDADAISPITEERQSMLEPSSTRVRSPVDSGLAAQDTQLIQSQETGYKEDKHTAPLSYRKRSFVLLIIYLPIIIIPWVLQQVLAVRPLNEPSYYNQRGEYGGKTYLASLWWPVMVRLLNVIGALITVPVVGALLSQAAVIHTQRRHPGQQLNLRQTLALAGKSWGDVLAVWAAINGNGTASRFLKYATGLLIISVIQLPLQQILISNRIILIMTCADNPVFGCGTSPVVVAHDPEPDYLAKIRQNPVVKQTMDKLATTFDHDEQPHLWRDPQGASAGVMQNNRWSTSTFFYWFDGVADADESFFISHVLNNTQTGILREHAMRLNSTTECSRIARDQFPATCGGTMPLVKTLDDPKNITIRICAPGDYGTSPWTLSRDRQDIAEELFVDVFFPGNTTILPEYAGLVDYRLSNFTTSCTTTTTRGYFELPNYRNDYLAQPLTEKWPDNETMWNEWNDYIWNDGNTVPSTIDIYSDSEYTAGPQGPDPFGTWGLFTPGPLMTVALALFGNGSFFHSANEAVVHNDMSIMNQTCQDANFPFQRIDLYSSITFGSSFIDACGYVADRESQYSRIESAGDIEIMYYNWVKLFNNTDLPSIGDQRSGLRASPSSNAAAALDIGVYLATEAWLAQTASGSLPIGPREIYTSPGAPAVRPKTSLAATIIISALIAVQVGGLVALVWYIYTIPTWTPQLNALAVAQMAQSIPEGHLPPMGPISDAEMRKLEKLDGLVGVANDDWGIEGGLAAKAENVQLARGAAGIVRRSMRPKKRKGKGKTQKVDRGTLESGNMV